MDLIPYSAYRKWEHTMNVYMHCIHCMQGFSKLNGCKGSAYNYGLAYVRLLSLFRLMAALLLVHL